MQKRSFCAADSRLVGQGARHCTRTYKFITYSQQLALNIIMIDMNSLTIHTLV